MQRYLWQQADGKRHVYDTTAGYALAEQPFTALGGKTVTPRVSEGDLTPGLWLKPECQICTIALAKAEQWEDEELGVLARRFSWTSEQLDQLAAAIRSSAKEALKLIAHRPRSAD